ncbi:YbaK/EbsC family protein [Boseongicola aestuarii]|uniref:Cys-tRNA(Pro)/Cys-tRNA(Cys) deacylase YbaK n=1 Tax=Boseongicola aestuarii TaxID=1470561 RepID=A0A238IWM4_9RHOB|nr:YbaK/EbsC family protein [Boseongicola aestuarii]SMX22443.1 Cys-tRNA(Pro)/Cys-tRNA(Cys) deacylase YbaK [Boseongicola aestuarii]
MSKSKKRVVAALEAAGLNADILHMANETRTAADAAREASCEIDQIAKSIIFGGHVTGKIVLFITAGGNQVDAEKASIVAGEPLGRADAAAVRAETGFAIGGVAPVGHLTPPRAFFDPTLLKSDVIYAAAGTPHHIFPISSQKLLEISGAQISDFI